MTNWAQAERAALCDLLLEVGPDAPTLCDGWAARDLAAHLVVRERRPDAAPGILLSFGPAQSWTAKVQGGIADRPYKALVDEVRSGPPRWMPTRIPALDRLVNTVEMFVHHEDIRRARDGWEPRQLPDDETGALWSALGRTRFLLRRSPVGITIRGADGQEIVARKADRSVTLNGAPGEILLFAFGRGDHARVDLAGDDDAIAELRATNFGL